MLYRYSKFELKILLRNYKQLFLGLVIILFFPIYFQIYLDSEPETLLRKKYAEKETQSIIVNTLPLNLRETEEGEELFKNYTEQLSIINMQIFYLNSNYGREMSEYITEGLRLNELRMEMHELGNPYVSNKLTIPIEEIEKENEFLNYLASNNLQEEDNPFVTSQFMLTSFDLLSGIFLFLIILIICSDMLVYEKAHQTVMRALPISFATKATSKILLHFIFITFCLILGILLGVFRSSTAEGWGNFSYPTLIYMKDGFVAIPIMKYVSYVLFAICIAIFMTVVLTLILSVFVQNMYGVALAGIGVFFLPDLLNILGLKANFFNPIKYIDVSGVLSGRLAMKFGDVSITYWNSILSMVLFTIILMGIIYVYHWFLFRGKNS